MLLGEYTSMRAIHSLLPGLVPKPHGPSNSIKRYFLLYNFLEVDFKNAPDPDLFTKKVAELHKYGSSENGKFGFHVPTYDGKLPQPVDWQSSWALFFTNLLTAVLKLDIEVNGVWPEFQDASKQLLDAVIPRLLGTLQSEGRSIKPNLIHGNLSPGNFGTSMETGGIILNSPCSLYAHNEIELGAWRCEWAKFLQNRMYFMKYFTHYPQAEPKNEWEDRNRLYGVKYNVSYSARHPGSVTRET